MLQSIHYDLFYMEMFFGGAVVNMQNFMYEETKKIAELEEFNHKLVYSTLWDWKNIRSHRGTN